MAYSNRRIAILRLSNRYSILPTGFVNSDHPQSSLNAGRQLTYAAEMWPEEIAVAVQKRSGNSFQYEQATFRELEDDSNLLAEGLLNMGMQPGMRVVLMVRPGIDFLSLFFGMLKAGLVVILIDPGMGRKNLIQCLALCKPEGFIAIPLVHAIRTFLPGKFPDAKHFVTVGWRWFWGGTTLAALRKRTPGQIELPTTQGGDPAAIIFTTGSTGPPKGVLYRHENFAKQATEVRDHYEIQPGEIDVAGFPLFVLFNVGMGVTTVLPDMDFTRPASVKPAHFLAAVGDFNATQSFGSPALWNTIAAHCEKTGDRLPTVRRVMTAGAPVAPLLIERVKKVIHPDGEIYTPYGATESLPVASISGADVLAETAAATNAGKGVCVGSRFPGIDWKIIEINDGPITKIGEVREVSRGEIGEIMVAGEVVTTEYVTGGDHNALHKVADGDRIWHRIGDVGYLDAQDRFWFCGRKSHRVTTPEGVLFTIQVEAIFNNHPHVYRSALVGVGAAGEQRPIVVIEPLPEHFPTTNSQRERLIGELTTLAQQDENARHVQTILIHKSLPVDIRHNSKIFREQLVKWAERRL